MSENTRPQPSAEPVAWMYTDSGGEASLHGCRLDNTAKLGWTETPLYPASALEGADRIAALEADNKRLREALEQFLSLIEYQYCGSREAMNALQEADNSARAALGEK